MQRDNWRREFYLGLQDQPQARQWLKLESELPALLAQRRPYFFIVRYPELQQILARHRGLYSWGRFDRVVLLSNRPPPEAPLPRP